MVNEGKLAPMNVHLAIDYLRQRTWAAFDETVEISVNLGVDPRKPNQAIKGVARLPHGTGKQVRVCVFASGADAQSALEAGADVVGAEDLVERVQKGDMPFDTVIATPEMMPLVGKIGKILGPKGLMPNPKMGSVTKDVARAIKAAKAGAVQFRVEKAGIIQAGIGKLSFKNDELLNNLRSFMVAVSDAKPEGLKGKYIMTVSLSSTMGPGIPLDAANCDPSSAKFILDPSKMGSL
jgi:large subunit ribosomal protein L1